MSEPRDDDGALSPEDLKRLGLAGHGVLSWLRRAFEGFPAFLRALRPGWHGLLRTIGLCWVLHWLGIQLGAALHLSDHVRFEAVAPTLSDAVAKAISGPIESPFTTAIEALYFPWVLGYFALAPLFALAMGISLLRTAEGRVRRVWVGAIVVASAATGIVMAISGTVPTGGRPDRPEILIPNGVILFAGITVTTWLLYRATGIARRRSGLTECAPALLGTALIVVNVGALSLDPIGAFSGWFRLADRQWLSPAFLGFYETVWAIRAYTIRTGVVVFLFVPALIVTRGLAFRPALRLLGRIVIRRTNSFLAGLLGLAFLAVLPIRGLLWAVPRSLGWVPYEDLFPDSVVWSLCYGIQTGLLVYAIALVADGLVVSLGEDQAESDLERMTLS